MSKQQQHSDIQSLWQSVETTPITMSAEEMRARAVAFERKVRRRNMTEYIASAFIIAGFAWYATWPEPATPLWLVANILIIIGALVVVWNLHRLAHAATPPPDASAASLTDFQRAQLVRQRDALRTVWRWYLLPFAPGGILWFAAIWFGRKPNADTLALAIGLGLAALVSATVTAGIILLNLRGAAQLQRQIDEIESYEE